MRAATGLGENSTVSELGKEGAAHYCTWCEASSPVGKLFLCDLMTELHVD